MEYYKTIVDYFYSCSLAGRKHTTFAFFLSPISFLLDYFKSDEVYMRYQSLHEVMNLTPKFSEKHISLSCIKSSNTYLVKSSTRFIVIFGFQYEIHSS